MTTNSRRGLLKGGLAAAGGMLLAPQAATPQAPAVITAKRFKGWVSVGRNSRIEEMTLRPISGRQVLVRTEASSLCYTNVGAVLGARLTNNAPAGPPAATPAKPPAAAPQRPLLRSSRDSTSKDMAASALSKPSDPKCAACAWAIVSASLAHLSAATAINAYGGAPINAHSSSTRTSFPWPTSPTAHRSTKIRTSAAWPST
jgi:hypothetical protein